MCYYALHDSDPKLQAYGAMPIKKNDAERANQAGYGIFQTVNEFDGKRQIDNLKQIKSWAIDMDDGNKSDMLKKIRSGLVPSMVVETRRGYHVYFYAKDGQPKHWETIVSDRLVPFYSADKRARDMARILRAPGYYHMKDPKDPFLVKKIWEFPVKYSERDMAYFYPDTREEERKEFVAKQEKESGGSATFWEKVYRLDCMDALEKLSGHSMVNNEIYTFRKNSNGNFNIIVNGKSTSTWIDRNGKIGSMDGGGPSVWNWITWFGHKPAVAADFVDSFFFGGTHGTGAT